MTEMPALAALIARCEPGLSIRQIAADAGLAENRIGYYLKPGSRINRLPDKATVSAFARALGCAEED